MLDYLPQPLEDYCRTHSTRETDIFAELAEHTRAQTDQPEMMVGPIEGLLLKTLVRFAGARRVLEIGTFTGYSTLSIAEGLPGDGVVIACDIDPATSDIARSFWKRSPHGTKIQLHLRPALETIAEVNEPLDMVFIDADKENYENYWEACVPKVRRGGVIVADNVLWSGRVLAPEDDETRAIAAFNERVREDSRVEQVMLPIRDGITLATKL